LFFTAAAALQLLWAAAVLTWPRRRLLVMGATGNAAVIFIWLASRTVGLPVGPEPWTREAITFPDMLATVFEGGVVLLAVLLRSNTMPIEDVLISRLSFRFRVFTVVLSVMTLGAILQGH
jgi:hypothetical protein